MSKEQFEHIENRIREAAENSVPAFDEQAWLHMEAKLDKEKKDKRRFFIWWWLAGFLLLSAGLGSYLYVTVPNYKEGSVAAKNTEKIKPVAGSKNLSAITVTTKKVDEKNANKVVENISSIPATIKKDDNKKLIVAADTPPASTVAVVKNKQLITSKNERCNSNRIIKKSTIQNDLLEENSSNELTINVDLHISKATVSTLLFDAPKKEILTTISPKDKAVINATSKNSTDKKASDKKTKKQTPESAAAHFYLIGSIGADAANVKLLPFKNTTITPKYGVGIGYAFNKKISVQTGFYASRKKYIAGPDDYNAKAGSYWNMVQILKVNASCLVYELPIALRYNFVQRPSFKLYATTGLSSFIMKNEYYDYHYIKNNMYHEADWTYTGNKNFLSMLTFSAGIEKRLSPVSSILVEPAVSLPITGVGDGRVKLFSTSLQVGFKYQPFKKKHTK